MVGAVERLEIKKLAEKPSNISRIENYLGTEKREIVTYDADFDTARYLMLQKLKLVNPEEYKRQKEELDNYTSQNLITCLKERFNVLLSRINYDIKDEKICREGSDEPFMDIMKRGRDYRKRHGNPIDWEREQVEVLGFEKIERVLADSKTSPETMILSISPRGEKGSTYTHNFYDIFVLKEKNGKRYIEAKRYSSALSNTEYLNAIKILTDKSNLPEDPDDAYFLSSPVVVKGKDPDSLHKFLHREHGVTSEEKFNTKILPHANQYIDEYINALNENPEDIYRRNLTFNAILNVVDEAEDNHKSGKVVPVDVYTKDRNYFLAGIRRYGRRGVRRKKTGCGISAGLSLGNLETAIDRIMKSAFSVSEFGMKDRHGHLTFICPSCNKENTRRMNELLTACQKCGSKAVSCNTSSSKRNSSKKPDNVEDRKVRKEEPKKVAKLRTKVQPTRIEQEDFPIRKAA